MYCDIFFWCCEFMTSLSLSSLKENLYTIGYIKIMRWIVPAFERKHRIFSCQELVSERSFPVVIPFQIQQQSWLSGLVFSEKVSLIAVSLPRKQVSVPILIQPGRSLNGELLPPHCPFSSCIFAEQLALALPLCIEVLLYSVLEWHVCKLNSP